MKKILFILFIPIILSAQSWDVKFYKVGDTTKTLTNYYKNGDTLETGWVTFQGNGASYYFCIFATDSISISTFSTYVRYKISEPNEYIEDPIENPKFETNGRQMFVGLFLSQNFIYKFKIIFSDSGNPVNYKPNAKFYSWVMKK